MFFGTRYFRNGKNDNRGTNNLVKAVNEILDLELDEFEEEEAEEV